jgi:hypothetical protein
MYTATRHSQAAVPTPLSLVLHMQVVQVLSAEAEQVMAACGLPPAMPDGPPPNAMVGRMSERMGVVWHLVQGMASEVLAAKLLPADAKKAK